MVTMVPEWFLKHIARFPAEAPHGPKPSRQVEALEELLPEAFALVREASKRSLGQRHYDVQILGASEKGPSQGFSDQYTLCIFWLSTSPRVVRTNPWMVRRSSCHHSLLPQSS